MEAYGDVLGSKDRRLDGLEEAMKFLLYLLRVLFEAIVLGSVLAFVLAELIRRGYLDLGG